MNKKILLILCMLLTVTTMWSQVYENDDETPDEDEITVIDREGREFYAVEHLLALNPNIMGAAVAYNPDCEPRKGEPFSPYAYHDSTGIHTKQLNTKEYDYLHQEWYTKPISEGKGVWSDPYLDEGGGEIRYLHTLYERIQ